VQLRLRKPGPRRFEKIERFSVASRIEQPIDLACHLGVDLGVCGSNPKNRGIVWHV
jgi:hypothetical protein